MKRVVAGQVWQHKRTGRQLRIVRNQGTGIAEIEYLDTRLCAVISHITISGEFDLVSEPVGV